MVTGTWRLGVCLGLAGWLVAAAAPVAGQQGGAVAQDALAGEYQAGPTTITVVLLGDGTLTLSLPGQPVYHLVPQGGLRYRMRELAPAYAVDFVRDSKGAVTGMTVHQPPPQNDFQAVRKGARASQGAAASPAPAMTAPRTPGVASAAAPVSSPSSGSAASTSADWARVPGVDVLTPEDRAFALKESGDLFDTCQKPRAATADLGNLYECTCLARTMLTARLRAGFEMTQRPADAVGAGFKPERKVPTATIQSDMISGRVSMNACIAPEKVAAWGADWYTRMWPAFRRIDPEDDKDRMSACVARAVAEAYQKRPGPDINYLGGLASDAGIRCRQGRPTLTAPSGAETPTGGAVSAATPTAAAVTPANPSASAAPAPASGGPVSTSAVPGLDAKAVRRFVHKALGFSLDIPADWTVRETPTGFQARLGTGTTGPAMAALTIVEPRPGVPFRQRFHEGRETIGRGETTIEFPPHPQGDAMLKVSRTIARVPSSGDMTRLSYEFFLDAGDQRWSFGCGDMLTGAHPTEHIPACLTAVRTFRAGTVAPVAVPALRTITFVEGPSIEVPGDAQGSEGHTSSRPSRTAAFMVISSGMRLELQGFSSISDLAELRLPPTERLRRGLPAGTISDFDLPGARAFVFRNPQASGGPTFIFWVQLANRLWTFDCVELSTAGSGSCETTMRTFRVR